MKPKKHKQAELSKHKMAHLMTGHDFFRAAYGSGPDFDAASARRDWEAHRDEIIAAFKARRDEIIAAFKQPQSAVGSWSRPMPWAFYFFEQPEENEQ